MCRQYADECCANREPDKKTHSFFVFGGQKGETAFLPYLKLDTCPKGGRADMLVAPNGGFSLKMFSVIFQIPQWNFVFYTQIDKTLGKSARACKNHISQKESNQFYNQQPRRTPNLIFKIDLQNFAVYLGLVFGIRPNGQILAAEADDADACIQLDSVSRILQYTAAAVHKHLAVALHFNVRHVAPRDFGNIQRLLYGARLYFCGSLFSHCIPPPLIEIYANAYGLMTESFWW